MPRRRLFRRFFSRAISAADAPSSMKDAERGASAGSAARVFRSALQCGSDPLKRRLMLYMPVNPITGLPVLSGQVEFLENTGGAIRIAWNDMNFELIGAAVGTAGDKEGDPVD